MPESAILPGIVAVYTDVRPENITLSSNVEDCLVDRLGLAAGYG
jgi:hypothetical protein